MTTYTIRNAIVQFFVIQTFAPDHFIEHGPYKNEASAKRRIRDLKAKENKVFREQPAKIQNASAVEQYFPPVPAAVLARDETGPRLPQMVAQRNAQLANDRVTHHHNGNVSMPIKRASIDWDKTADPFLNIAPINGNSKPFMIQRQVGCYPAISKRAYLR